MRKYPTHVPFVLADGSRVAVGEIVELEDDVARHHVAMLIKDGGVARGPDGLPPPMFEGVVARVAREGWAPRAPAFEPELAQLEKLRARGTCLEPLVVEGDLLYVDPHAPALPGDLVAFSLSERFSREQNSNLPPGQTPGSAGDRWAKLLTNWAGLDMLVDKYGTGGAATFLACEHSGDAPTLHPVRNIRRKGRLLFTPREQDTAAPVHTLQLAGNAVTIPVSNNFNGSIALGNNGAWDIVTTPSITVDGSTPILVSAMLSYWIGYSTSTTVEERYVFLIRCSDGISSLNGASSVPVHPTTPHAISPGAHAWTHMPAAGTYTFTLRVSHSGAATVSGTVWVGEISAMAVKR